MARWGVVFVGFILAVIVKTFFGLYELPGLLLVGLIVGLMAHQGALGGLWNAALAGAFGNIVCAIIFILIATLGGGALGGLFGGLVGFTVSGVASFVDIIGNIIYYIIVMGIAGAVGGAISSSRN